MTEDKKIILDVRAKQYILDELKMDVFLANNLLAKIDTTKGTSYTYAQYEPDEKELYEFRYYHEWSDPDFMQRKFINEIIKFVNQLNPIILFEETDYDRSEVHKLRRNKNLKLFYKDLVYYYLPIQDTEHNLILDFMNWSETGWRNIYYISCLPSIDFLKNENELIDKDILTIVDHTKMLISTAYDLDGYIFWNLEK